MPLRSPDETVVDAVDAVMAVPQRRGVPLPALLVPLPFVEAIGLVLAGAGFASAAAVPGDADGTDPLMLVLGATLAVGGLADGLAASARARRYRRDADGWCPALAARYRLEALAARTRDAATRRTSLVLALGVLVVTARLTLSGDGVGIAQLAPALAGFCVALSGRVATHYAECAFPQEPDLGRRAVAAA